VELDLKVAKMTENAMLYEAGVTLLKKKIQMFQERYEHRQAGKRWRRILRLLPFLRLDCREIKKE